MTGRTKTAPAFSLPDKDGRIVNLSDFSGKWIILYFYPKDNTSGCTLEAIDFTAIKKDLARRNAIVIGVSPDRPDSHKNFIQKHRLDVLLLCDEEKKVLKKYGAWGLKKNYGKEYEGVIRTTVLISPDGKIADIWPNVKVRIKRSGGEVKHADAVLQRLDELN
ncbi:MAG: peroxiredoxin [Candidatus Eisenbacteria bacterium]|uniref:thioredoxin-dependent peroxiredoxin n=1 Tax=Eiseniibacteriota bacterium TaxID=2212470 RepID=A0A948RUW1_UNCEI|nr:peroxiredoxin [Candidatus Eisenbacteria bacterium]MBU1949348.1 peroxiredoxin [Candidatus Eisenbacteria bacterium]MBU2690421.1 peroxiredoxin [Candidatus Eisenbacteria bacterium]